MMRQMSGPPTGAYIGSMTIDVYHDGKEFQSTLSVRASEALQQMNALLSPEEVSFAQRVKMETTKTAVAFFSFIRNPDQIKAK
jgi:hypothetical protein